MTPILLDQGLPRSTAALLRQRGYDAIHVGEVGMAPSPDEAIIQFARESCRSIVTLDADFHTIIAVAMASGPSVIRLRIQRLKAPEAATLISTVLEQDGHELNSGCSVTVALETIRIRRLPLRKK